MLLAIIAGTAVVIEDIECNTATGHALPVTDSRWRRGQQERRPHATRPDLTTLLALGATPRAA